MQVTKPKKNRWSIVVTAVTKYLKTHKDITRYVTPTLSSTQQATINYYTHYLAFTNDKELPMLVNQKFHRYSGPHSSSNNIIRTYTRHSCYPLQKEHYNNTFSNYQIIKNAQSFNSGNVEVNDDDSDNDEL